MARRTMRETPPPPRGNRHRHVRPLPPQETQPPLALRDPPARPAPWPPPARRDPPAPPPARCCISGLNALYDAATGGGDVWINEHRFHVIRQIGEGGFTFVYLVRELQPSSDAAIGCQSTSVDKEQEPKAKRSLLDNASNLPVSARLPAKPYGPKFDLRRGFYHDAGRLFWLSQDNCCCLDLVYFLLAQNPTKMRKAQAEVDSVLSNGAITVESLKNMEYIKSIIVESLRLYP